jgi:uncharacterized protein (DUF58 family)
MVLVPFAIVAGAVPGAFPVAVAVIAGFILVALLDATRAPGRSEGLHIEGPPLVRLQKSRDGLIELILEHGNARLSSFRVGLDLPVEVGSQGVDRTVRLSPGAERSALSWPCKPRERGKYLLERAFIEASSPLAFWGARTTQSLHCEIRVYPDLMKERRNLAALFLRRAQSGALVQAFAGQGREFEKLRAYQAGDSVSDIHWKATAKRGSLVSKVYQVERTQEVYVLLDASRLSARSAEPSDRVGSASPGEEGDEVPASGGHAPEEESTILERYVTGALLLGHAAEQQGDQFGLVTFSDHVHSFLRARTGQAHFDAVRDQLYTLQARSVSPDFEELFSLVRLRLRKRALLVVLTNLDDPVLAESFVKASELVSRQHMLLVNMLNRDGVKPLFEDAEDVRQTGDLYEQLAGHFQWQHLRELAKVLQRRGVRLSFFDSNSFSADLIAQHANVRARQLV